MKNELTAKRLQQSLSDANMKPQELADRSGVSKASISQYVNGSHAPGNISAEKMGEILNVNPLWLMGFDVSKTPNKEKKTIQTNNIQKATADFPLSDLEKKVVRKFRLLGDGERKMFLRSLEINEETQKNEKMA